MLILLGNFICAAVAKPLLIFNRILVPKNLTQLWLRSKQPSRDAKPFIWSRTGSVAKPCALHGQPVAFRCVGGWMHQPCLLIITRSIMHCRLASTSVRLKNLRLHLRQATCYSCGTYLGGSACVSGDLRFILCCALAG